jgi:hypothetical protein
MLVRGRLILDDSIVPPLGQRADLVELDDELDVVGVARGGEWISPR